MVVTTSTRVQKLLASKAEELARQFGIPFIRRGRQSIQEIIETNGVDKLLLVTSTGIKCIFKEDMTQPFFFHPSSAMFRLKRLIRGEHDPFLEATQLSKGMSFLDCTLGLASDAIVAAYTVGPEGQVLGVESEPIVAAMVEDGLQTWEGDLFELNEAMRRVRVLHSNHEQYLHQCEEGSFDVVYFDPMFEVTVQESLGITPLKKVANYDRLSIDVIEEAKRVAKQRVVLKDSSYSKRFSAWGFSPIVRKYATHWFGTIELE